MIAVDDLSDCIDLVAETVEIVRHVPPSVIKGRAGPRIEDEKFPADGSFQPMKGRELQLLPENMRNKGAAKFYTSKLLLTTDTAAASIPDRLIRNDVTWQVEAVDDWDSVAGYHKVLLTRVTR